ncbi:MAG: type 2 isopentenyl-diphosphate Delta-isomerase [Candidatus Bathyarchaeia archaeon]|nr:type 2 isopentenyl-diphosphate Delta-isomerase [Candidatus Bathyarchaeota archaeon]
MKASTDIENRKRRHLRVVLEEDVENEAYSGLQDVQLVHRALPEIDLEEVSTEISLFSRRLSAPIIISAMTGGIMEAERINEALAEMAEAYGLGIGVGSQRIALEDPRRERAFRIVREKAPSSLVIGNLGCPQLSTGWGPREARRCLEMIDADALAIHMNPLQEAVQVGGEARYRGLLKKIREIVEEIDKPVIMKETGCGVSLEDAVEIERAGAEGIDVSGVGGTSWAAVEQHIAREEGKTQLEALGRSLRYWGIPTAISIVEVVRSTRLKVIASGGIRTGLDAAKAIALGADVVGLARPFLEKVIKGREPLKEYVEQLLMELKTVMFLTGSRSTDELRRKPVIILGKTAEWLRLRGFKPEDYSKRS